MLEILLGIFFYGRFFAIFLQVFFIRTMDQAFQISAASYDRISFMDNFGNTSSRIFYTDNGPSFSVASVLLLCYNFFYGRFLAILLQAFFLTSVNSSLSPVLLINVYNDTSGLTLFSLDSGSGLGKQ